MILLAQQFLPFRNIPEDIYRVLQGGECARLRENVPYVKVNRYNPKHLYLKLNGSGDNGGEKCGLLAVPRTVRVQRMRYPYTAHVRPREWNAVNVAGLYQNAQSAMLNQYFNTAGYSCAI